MSSSIRILLFASLRDAAGADVIEVVVPLNSLPVAHLLQLCAEQFPALAPWLPHVRVAVNCEYVAENSVVLGDDEIALIPPVSGGSNDATEELPPLCELTHQPIETSKVMAAARARLQGGEGAVVTFEGVVRNNAKGHLVNFLEYVAYEPMARRELRRISDEVQQRWGLPCALTHRLGRLEIGEASIVIVVASPHRAEAFEACRYAIDRVKTSVPIWKKEVARDGTWWVEDPLQSSVAHSSPTTST